MHIIFPIYRKIFLAGIIKNSIRYTNPTQITDFKPVVRVTLLVRKVQQALIFSLYSNRFIPVMNLNNPCFFRFHIGIGACFPLFTSHIP